MKLFRSLRKYTFLIDCRGWKWMKVITSQNDHMSRVTQGSDLRPIMFLFLDDPILPNCVCYAVDTKLHQLLHLANTILISWLFRQTLITRTFIRPSASQVEIPLKNRSRFERFSSKIWAVWAVFLEKPLKPLKSCLKNRSKTAHFLRWFLNGFSSKIWAVFERSSRVEVPDSCPYFRDKTLACPDFPDQN